KIFPGITLPAGQSEGKGKPRA
ncbi:MAG: hypothetical protein RLZ58_169, partial [Pseudomonadota bacterium]